MTDNLRIFLGVMILLSLVSAFVIIKGPTVWDRLVALNLVTSKTIVIILLLASIRKESFLLDVALMYALLSFIGVIFMAISIKPEHQGLLGEMPQKKEKQ